MQTHSLPVHRTQHPRGVGDLPVWLTAEEYQALLGGLLDADDAERAKRLVQILRRARERANEWAVTMPGANRLLGEQSPYQTVARWVILLALFMCLCIIVSRV